MPYDYIAETSHGDAPFTTDTHHELHHSSFHEWFQKWKPEIDSAISTGAQIFSIWTTHRGQKAQKIAESK